jgi:hypothetical protein
VAVVPSELTLQPRAAPSKTSTAVDTVAVGGVVADGAEPPPPQALNISKNPTVIKVCLLNRYMDHPHYIWF